MGCLLGVAVGDALGYPIEFQRHGPFTVSGMTSPYYSDDTQMTLATTEGLIKSKETGNPTAEVYREYLRWLDSQSDPSSSVCAANWLPGVVSQTIVMAARRPSGCTN